MKFDSSMWPAAARQSIAPPSPPAVFLSNTEVYITFVVPVPLTYNAPPFLPAVLSEKFASLIVTADALRLIAPPSMTA